MSEKKTDPLSEKTVLDLSFNETSNNNCYNEKVGFAYASPADLKAYCSKGFLTKQNDVEWNNWNLSNKPRRTKKKSLLIIILIALTIGIFIGFQSFFFKQGS